MHLEQMKIAAFIDLRSESYIVRVHYRGDIGADPRAYLFYETLNFFEVAKTLGLRTVICINAWPKQYRFVSLAQLAVLASSCDETRIVVSSFRPKIRQTPTPVSRWSVQI